MWKRGRSEGRARNKRPPWHSASSRTDILYLAVDNQSAGFYLDTDTISPRFSPHNDPHCYKEICSTTIIVGLSTPETSDDLLATFVALRTAEKYVFAETFKRRLSIELAACVVRSRKKGVAWSGSERGTQGLVNGVIFDRVKIRRGLTLGSINRTRIYQARLYVLTFLSRDDKRGWYNFISTTEKNCFKLERW